MLDRKILVVLVGIEQNLVAALELFPVVVQTPIEPAARRCLPSLRQADPRSLAVIDLCIGQTNCKFGLWSIYSSRLSAGAPESSAAQSSRHRRSGRPG